ncbi:MAG: type II toxin-antitoxin system prevent-host-death family antitoxin [Candidatus Marinimicrobia bacterium]|nr:type II toxin-antitoxin system prevent-host-death family antitoxin [Candidatus Neomarinimicrobiota bacterium]
MNALTDRATEYQTINHNGKPAFVLVPVDDYERIRPMLEIRETIPHEVVEQNVLHDVPLIKAWREHLDMTQEELAEKAGMKQPALARLERGDGKPRTATLKRLADAMGIAVEALEE